MLIHETGKAAGLTKKALEYYVEQKLVFPEVLENGYRDFSENDVKRLRRISILRRLGLGTEEIRRVLADETGGALRKCSVRKELNTRREQAKNAILEKLCRGGSDDEADAGLKALEQSATVTEKLLEAFPEFYSRMVCLHFARFLNEPIVTDEQQSAYEEIIAFLDRLPALDFPEAAKSFFAESMEQLSMEAIGGVLGNMKQSVENPDRFLSEHKEALEYYLAYRQSEEYRNSRVFQMKALLKKFHSASGYDDVFIPAMKRLSASYAEYQKLMELANEKLLSQYPEIAELDN